MGDVDVRRFVAGAPYCAAATRSTDTVRRGHSRASQLGELTSDALSSTEGDLGAVCVSGGRPESPSTTTSSLRLLASPLLPPREQESAPARLGATEGTCDCSTRSRWLLLTYTDELLLHIAQLLGLPPRWTAPPAEQAARDAGELAVFGRDSSRTSLRPPVVRGRCGEAPARFALLSKRSLRDRSAEVGPVPLRCWLLRRPPPRARAETGRRANAAGPAVPEAIEATDVEALRALTL